MLFSEFANRLESGEIEPVYFFAGSEFFLHNLGRKLLKKKIIEPSSEDFDFELIDGNDYQFEKLANAIRSLPMMSSNRLVIVSRFNEIDGRQYKKILGLFENVSYSGLTVAFNYEAKLDSRQKSSLAQFKEKFSFVDVSSPKSREYMKLLKFLSPDREIDANLAGYLAESGVDLWQISIWFDQAANLTDPNEKITLDKLQDLVDLGGTADIWRFEDAVGKRDLQEAQILLQDLLINHEKPGTVLYRLKELFVHLDLMGKIRHARANPDKYRRELDKEILSFRFNKIYSYSKNFSVDNIENALLKIQETDYLMKTSGGDQNSLLIELLDGIIGRK